MNIAKIILSALAFSAISNSAAYAAPIIYSVDLQAGLRGTLVGTVTTDGTVGNITGANFIAWDLIISGEDQLGHVIKEILSSANSNLYSGREFVSGVGIVGTVTGLSASTTALTFDFDNRLPSFLLFQKQFGSGTSFTCIASSEATNVCHQGIGLVPTNTDPDGTFAGWGTSTSGTRSSGLTVLATAVEPETAVPEPATWLSTIAGFGFIAAWMRKRAKIMTRRFAA